MGRNPRRDHRDRLCGLKAAAEQEGHSPPLLPMNGFAPRGENDRAQLDGLGSTAEPEDSGPANER